jgi:hypothetical protein
MSALILDSTRRQARTGCSQCPGHSVRGRVHAGYHDASRVRHELLPAPELACMPSMDMTSHHMSPGAATLIRISMTGIQRLQQGRCRLRAPLLWTHACARGQRHVEGANHMQGAKH